MILSKAGKNINKNITKYDKNINSEYTIYNKLLFRTQNTPYIITHILYSEYTKYNNSYFVLRIHQL